MNEKNYRNILVAVSGLTPQIITETLYGLMIERGVSIHKIVIITTKTGEEKLNSSFLKPNGPYYQFFKEFDILPHKIEFKPELIMDDKENVLDDIRTLSENEFMAHTILKTIFELTKVEENRIFASIAGGRKTMSAYMALALQMFGREQDKLMHVLIWPPSLEFDRNFYFPSREPRNIQTSDGKIINWNEVRVDLAEIPYIRMRPVIENWFGSELENYIKLIEYSEFAIEELKRLILVTWKPKERKITVKFGDREFNVGPFPPKLAAIYHFLFNSKVPLQIQIENKRLQDIYQDQFSQKVYDDKFAEPKWAPDTIQRDISSINHDYFKKILPEPIMNLVKISAKKSEDGRNAYYIKLPMRNRSIQ